MAPDHSALVETTTSASPSQLNPDQTLRAATALLRKIQTDEVARKTNAEKPSLLADADEEDVEDGVPVWLVLTTKNHIVDKKRMKPGKLSLPHPFLDAKDEKLRICMITADPQRTYKDLIIHQSFPVELGKRIQRVIGITKLKAKYKSYESRRQLLGEYDVFLADDRIITYLPSVLGKVFYKSSSKRPIPVTLEGKRQSKDEQGNKRRKLAEGGTKVVKDKVKPADVAKEVERTLSSALVHLAPSTTTAVRVGTATMEPAHLQDNVERIVEGLVDRYVPQKWSNVRAVHIKGPNTAALPIWMAQELWEDEQDVLDEPLPTKEKKRKRGALTEEPTVIEVPGPDGKMRRIEKPSTKRKSIDGIVSLEKPAKKPKSIVNEEDAAKAAEKAEKDARKASLKQQKDAAKAGANGAPVVGTTTKAETDDAKKARRTRSKAADLI